MRPRGEQQTRVTEAESGPLWKNIYLPDAVHTHVANADPAGHTVPQSVGDMGVTSSVQAINSVTAREDIIVNSSGLTLFRSEELSGDCCGVLLKRHPNPLFFIFVVVGM